MDIIREHLLYKEIPLHVCVGDLTRQEQYEFLRCIIGVQKKHVVVCTQHGTINQYVLHVLRALGLENRECRRVE